MTNKDLIIHIGPGKTASTSIQKWIMKNLHVLHHLGILYPESGCINGCHEGIFTALLSETPFLSLTPGQSAPNSWEKLSFVLHDEICSDPSRTILLSYEGFCLFREEQISKLLELINPKKVIVIAALRDPLSHSFSLWQQSIKFGNVLEYSDYTEAVLERESIPLFLPGAYLHEWSCRADRVELIGSGKVLTSHFGNTLNQLIEILSSNIGSDFQDIVHSDPLHCNLSCSWQQSEFARLINKEFDLALRNDIPQELHTDFSIVRNNYLSSVQFASFCNSISGIAGTTRPVLSEEVFNKIINICSEIDYFKPILSKTDSSALIFTYLECTRQLSQEPSYCASQPYYESTNISGVLAKQISFAILSSMMNIFLLDSSSSIDGSVALPYFNRIFPESLGS